MKKLKVGKWRYEIRACRQPSCGLQLVDQDEIESMFDESVEKNLM
jgi:hypothetical protein